MAYISDASISGIAHSAQEAVQVLDNPALRGFDDGASGFAKKLQPMFDQSLSCNPTLPWLHTTGTMP